MRAILAHGAVSCGERPVGGGKVSVGEGSPS